jgi:hypothetical protein
MQSDDLGTQVIEDPHPVTEFAHVEYKTKLGEPLADDTHQ